MQIAGLRLAGLKVVTPSVFADARGFFLEQYRMPLYAQGGIDISFVQDNMAFSKKNTLRALHYQSKPGQAKLISCVQGKIFDVAVDIRPHSPTFGQWEGIELDDQTHRQLFIPVGFAHGYCVLSDSALVHYKVSALYDPKAECAIRWNDPRIGIAWPIQKPLLSPRDESSPFFDEVFA